MNKKTVPQEIIFVTGKGGVGKSAVAAALALKKSRQGMKTLLVELGSHSFFKDYFSLPEVGFQPIQIKENLDVALWSGPECLKEYAKYLLKVESLYKLFFENSVTRSLINVAPGLSELAIMGKVTSGPRKVGPSLDYDCLVVDSYATGHFLALVKAPQGMAEAINFGPMGEQSRSIVKVLKDPLQCQYVVVSIPEELPVQEAIELDKSIENLVGIKTLHVMNKVWPLTDEILKSVTQNQAVLKLQGSLEKQNYRQKQHEVNLKAALQNRTVINAPYIFSDDSWSIVEKIAGSLS